jgi:predicted metal-binding membrane protein
MAETRLSIVSALCALAAAAWVATALRMAGMDAGPGTDPGSLGFYSSTWTVMMAAMMLPSIAPAVFAYRGLPSRRRGAAGDATLFVVGYLAVWAVAGLVAYALLEAGRALDGGLFAWDRVGRGAAAGVLALAAAYELTPRKRACLAHCRGERVTRTLSADWREGPAGALRAGLAQGGWCLGCCWVLMAALFALGAMSLVWMVVIAAVIAAEKLLPWPTVSTAATAALLAALAIGLAAVPTRVPGLTIPPGRTAMHAMSMSG